jgi:ATP adenylyltransferase
MMTFDELRNFIAERMRMSHVYQPLLIRSLLEAGGTATVRQLAAEFQRLNEPQLLRMEKRIREMPLRVLRRHAVVTAERDLVRLNIAPLTFAQRSELESLCNQRIGDFLAVRGIAIWDFDLIATDPVPESVRYEVLRRASGKCALCGKGKDEEPLEVDHIVPRSRGGGNAIDNLQALCRTCNRGKSNRDATDFRLPPA